MYQIKIIIISIITLVFMTQLLYSNENGEERKKGFVANYGRTYTTDDGIHYKRVSNKYTPIYCKGVSQTEFVSYNNGLSWHKKSDISKRLIPIIDNRLELVPNPIKSTSELIAVFKAKTTVEIELIDLNGRVLKKWTFQANKGKNDFLLNFENIQSGTYILNFANIPGYKNIVTRIIK